MITSHQATAATQEVAIPMDTIGIHHTTILLLTDETHTLEEDLRATVGILMTLTVPILTPMLLECHHQQVVILREGDCQVTLHTIDLEDHQLQGVSGSTEDPLLVDPLPRREIAEGFRKTKRCWNPFPQPDAIIKHKQNSKSWIFISNQRNFSMSTTDLKQAWKIC